MQQVVGGIGAPLGNIVLPIGGLYRLVGASGASVNALGRAAYGLGGVNASRSSGPGRRYLIETDPRFVDYDNFISSDYLLDKLGSDGGDQVADLSMQNLGQPQTPPFSPTLKQLQNLSRQPLSLPPVTMRPEWNSSPNSFC